LADVSPKLLLYNKVVIQYIILDVTNPVLLLGNYTMMKVSDENQWEIVISSPYKELATKYKSLQINHGTEENLEDLLAQYHNIPTFVHNYLRSKFAKSRGFIKDAASYMDLVVQDSELTCLEGLLLRSIYGNAGEIYANNDEYEKALHYYQYYELWGLGIKSCDFSDGLLSFRSFNEHSLSDLVNNEVTVCSPRVMNDPYDTLLFKWGESFNRLNNKRKHAKAFAQSFDSYRIRSFCRLKDKDGNDIISNVLMWSHYAHYHEGFCIKYKFSEKFLKTEERFVSRFKDIIYHDRGIPLNLEVDSINSDLGLCTKLSDWSYENEVRLITYMPDKEGDYISLPLDDESSIEAIYFGCRCPADTIKTIKNALSNNSEIRYFKMDSDYRDIYRLKSSNDYCYLCS